LEEKDFKRLASNSRDWLIYQLLSKHSKYLVEAEKIADELIEDLKGERVLEDLIGEKTGGVEETPSKSSTNLANQTNMARHSDSKPAEIEIGTEVGVEKDTGKIVWVWHENKKYKNCRYKCGNYVRWDNNTKKYIHYDAEFKLIGADCPKYNTGVPTQ